MESIKKIGYVLIALVYLFLSTGVALVKTNCLCSDRTNISVYDISDAKDDILSDLNCCDENLPTDENNKDTHLSDCGCDRPTVTYLKLSNHAGSETNLEYPSGKTLYLVNFPDILIIKSEKNTAEVKATPYYSPPEKPYGRILISFLNQRKIALTA